MDKHIAENLLQKAVGSPDACFRSGQLEAIDALVNQRQKLLVVERTGWGKSSVYFISTRILRDRGAGPTIIVSPLLALMRNQIAAAERLGLRAVSINSTNRDDWQRLQKEVEANRVDAMLISPERLANETFVADVLRPIAGRVGLLVVDEAHCISDWGHDFRPDYRRLISVLRQLPPNMPLLATTATANQRVIADIQEQLGGIRVQRGTLARNSLVLQTLKLPDQSARLGWLAEHLPNLPGTGIVYTLTKHDAVQVTDWLSQRGVQAAAYYSGVQHPDFENSDAYRRYLEDLLLENRLKALVATPALGMGYDKPDLGFVIHYQMPGSVVSYYQQVGRAGRAIDRAYGVLLSGREDEEIHCHFRRSAFPDEQQVNELLQLLASADGLSIRDIEQQRNLRYGQIEKILKLLSVELPAPVIKQGSRWSRTAVPYRMDHDRIARLTAQRELEWQEMQAYLHSSDCLMGFLRKALDDPETAACGVCSECRGTMPIPATAPTGLIAEAARFLRHAEMPLEPKKQVPAGAFPVYGFRGNLPAALRAQQGRILSRWGDAGWGRQVADDKHDGHFRDALVEAAAQMLEQRWLPQPVPAWLTCVPSHRHPDLVPSLARRLADRLGLPFLAIIDKVRGHAPQKQQQNRFHQCHNLDGVFTLSQAPPSGPVLLLDDVVDSGWTLTVLAALLRQAGSGPVFPLALASTAVGD
jgi:ATP-dependent DNA helicase RecQ